MTNKRVSRPAFSPFQRYEIRKSAIFFALWNVVRRIMKLQSSEWVGRAAQIFPTNNEENGMVSGILYLDSLTDFFFAQKF